MTDLTIELTIAGRETIAVEIDGARGPGPTSGQVGAAVAEQLGDEVAAQVQPLVAQALPAEVAALFQSTGAMAKLSELLASIAAIAPYVPAMVPVLPAYAYAPETDAIAAAFAVAPSSRRKKNIDWAVRTLKGENAQRANVWAKIIGLWKVGADLQSSCVNWKTPGQSLTVVGAPALVPNASLTGGAGIYLRTGIALNSLTHTDLYIGMYSATAGAAAPYEMGAQDAVAGIALNPKITSTSRISVRLGGPIVNNSTAWPATQPWNGQGWNGAGRTDAAAITGYKGPVPQGSPASAAAANLGAQEIYLLGYNNNGVAQASARAAGAWVIAKGLTADEAKVLACVMEELQSSFVEGELDFHNPGRSPTVLDYDAIVYGTSLAAICEAYELKRQGRNVAIVGGWRDRDIGAMSSAGLGKADIINYASSGGLGRWIVAQIQARQGTDKFTFASYHARAVLRGMLDPSKAYGLDIPVYWSDGVANVYRQGGRTHWITTADGRMFRAAYFSDCSFEGDLNHKAGLSVRKGREAAGPGAEAINGYRGAAIEHAGDTHQLKNRAGQTVNVDPWRVAGDPSSGLLPGIAGVMGIDSPAIGAGDDRSQAYNFRVTACNNAAWRVPFPSAPPPGYDKLRYEPLGRLFAIDPTLVLGNLAIFTITESTTNTIDMNAMGGWSIDLWGASTDYMNARTYAEREVHWKRHWNHILGWFYYLQYEDDPRIPFAVRTSALAYGLSMLHYNRPHPNDDFGVNPQLYVREGWRLVGDLLWDANDMSGEDGTAPRSTKTISAASYQFDSHGTAAWADNSAGDWRIWIEGNLEQGETAGGADRISPMPYEVFLPRAAECGNICTPFGGSMTHVAMGSYRMELPMAQTAQSLACAIAIAFENGKQPLHQVDYAALRARILAAPKLPGETPPVLPLVN